MKVSVYKLVLLGIILSYCPILSAQDIIYVYRNDGKFNAFYSNEIDSMVCSHVGPDSASFHKNDYLVQEIYTADSIYRIPIAAIDSISSVVPEPILNDKVFPLTQEISPYVLSADTLMILTSVDQVALNYRSVNEKLLRKIDVREARSYMEEDQFEAGSMKPKFEAAVDFVELGSKRRAIITSIPRAKAAYLEKAGTMIVNQR